MLAAAESAINGEGDQDYWCLKCRKTQQYRDLFTEKPKKFGAKVLRHSVKKTSQKRISGSSSSGSTKNQRMDASNNLDEAINKK